MHFFFNILNGMCYYQLWKNYENGGYKTSKMLNTNVSYFSCTGAQFMWNHTVIIMFKGMSCNRTDNELSKFQETIFDLNFLREDKDQINIDPIFGPYIHCQVIMDNAKLMCIGIIIIVEVMPINSSTVLKAALIGEQNLIQKLFIIYNFI